MGVGVSPDPARDHVWCPAAAGAAGLLPLLAPWLNLGLLILQLVPFYSSILLLHLFPFTTV